MATCTAAVFAAAGQQEDEQQLHWYRADPAALDQLGTEGETDEPYDSHWSINPEGQQILGNHPAATATEQQQLLEILREQRGAFAYSLQDLPGYSGVLGPAHFDLKEDKPMWQSPRQYTADELPVGDKKVAEMLEGGIIYEVPTTVRHASAPTLPMKRAPDGSWTDTRFAIDMRHVNSNTVPDRYGMPLPEELFRRMRGARVLSKLDCRSGFFQIELDLPSQLHTVFHWRGKCYAFRRLPFGHVSATAIFQRRMEMELQAAGLTDKVCVFVDDICIYTDTVGEHLQVLQQLLQHLHKVGLRVHPAKSILLTDCLPYLGHLVTASELKPDPAKVAAMVALQPPSSIKRLQAHLGLFNYYRCYIPFFSHAAQPLYALLRKGAQFVWGDEQQEAYQRLKAALTQPGLALRQPDPDRPFRLYTDWSCNGIAAVLHQQDDTGQEHLVACVSRSLNDAEKQYPAWKGELLAAVFGIRAFRPYLISRPFQLLTDHRALLWMLTQKAPTGQLARWILSVSEYQFDLVHRAGNNNPADLPSREPVACAADWTGSRQDSGPPQCAIPQVFLPDGTTDRTVYTEQLLAAHIQQQQQQAAAQSPAAAQWWRTLLGCVALVQPNAAWAPRPSELLAEAAGNSPPAVAAKQYQHLCALCAISAAAGAGIDHHDPGASVAAPLLGGGTGPSFSQDFSASQQPTAAAQQPATASIQQARAAQQPTAAGQQQQNPAASHQEMLLQHPARAWPQQQLRQAASNWVAAACSRPVPAAAAAVSAPPLEGLYQGSPDAAGVRQTARLDTAPVTSTFFPAAQQQGVVLYEPFGGLCAGLEMVLRTGFRVVAYYYSDTDPKAQRVMQHRVQQLQQLYPAQLPQAALLHSTSTFPADVQQVGTSSIRAAASRHPTAQWLVVAGWPCQDFSQAGRAAGLVGGRAQLLYDVVRVIGTLQQLMPLQPPGYVLENVPMQLHPDARIAQGDFGSICSIVGQPVMVDAAQCGSLAHRLRNFWGNLCSPKQLAGAVSQIRRPAGRTVQLALLPHRQAHPVTRGDQPPQHLCNTPGQPRAAWPTLMSRRASYAFRPQQPGSIWDTTTPAAPRWAEPTAVEREVALGLLPGSTAAAALSDGERCALLGQCIDANALQCIMAISMAWWHWKEASASAAGATPAAPGVGVRGGAAAAAPAAAAATASKTTAAAANSSCTGGGNSGEVHPWQALLTQLTACAAQEALTAGGSAAEIWLDHPALSFLQSGQLSADSSNKEKIRVQQRAKSYRWNVAHQHLLHVQRDGSTRIVPQPDQRLQLVQQQHERCGHFGVRRTAALLSTKYWWHGLLADTAAVVSRCQHCSRVQASFSSKGNRTALQSIPISSMGFRWHVDLAGPFPESRRGSRYVLVAVEAFSKWLEVVPLPNKEADTVAYAYLHNVLARFAAPGQVVSDNGAEFTEGEFAQLLGDCLIDHCTTSPAHPQANGQAEKAVDIVKRALRKMCLQRHQLEDWDTDVAWLCMGYRCSPHSSSGFTPYELLYARRPVVPPAVRSGMQQPLQLDDPAVAATDLLQRRQLVQRLCPEALENLSIAQHRDQRRYAVVRSKGYQPRMYRFQPGDYVYTQQLQRHSTLQPQAKPSILRVKQVLPSGVLQLQGKCGRTAEVHMDLCAPCHLPHLDGDIDPLLVAEVDSIVCEVCAREEPESHLLLCDICNAGYHTFCLQPPLNAVPSGDWLCPQCTDEGYTAADAAAREQQRQHMQEEGSRPVLFPSAAMRRRDNTAAGLDGRLLLKSKHDPATGLPASYWGRVHYRGPQYRPYYFLVVYEDGATQQVTRRALAKWLMPADTQLPAVVVIPSQPPLAQ